LRKNRDFIGGGVEIGKGTKEMGEKGGVYAGHRESAAGKPVYGFHDGRLPCREVELEEEKEG